MGPGGNSTGMLRAGICVLLILLVAVVGVPARAGPPEPPTLTVRADGTGDHPTLQAAIDAAQPGALILIDAGTFEGHVRIDKPVTLRGAGFGATHLTSLLFKRCDLNSVNRSMMPRLRQARTESARQAVWAEIRARREALVRPTVLVEDTHDVVLEGLRLSGKAEREEGVVNPGAVVAVRRAAATLRDCAVLGSPGRGIAVHGGGDVDVERCLVAAIWATGIEIGVEGEATARARVRGCDVRRCVHRGITIAPGCDEVLLEDNRITLSAWHGVRYDDASPTIRGNLILGHQKSGIYASGDTHATVEGNLLLGNAGEGMSCWFQNHDTIRRNTFANNDVLSIGLAGGSRPVVEQNVFYRSYVAIDGSHLAPEDASGESVVAVFPIRANVWFKCTRLTRRLRRGTPADEESYEDLPLPPDADNLRADPGFADAAALDFTLPEDAPAGARAAPRVESPWPVQPEEKTMKEAWGEGCAAAGN